jgi:lysozyme
MDNLTQRIIEHEGFKLFPYRDSVGKLTIGIGRNLSDRGISRDEAMLLMNNDLAESRMELSHFEWFTKLDIVRQEVLIELHFNIGLTSLLKFELMIQCLSKEMYRDAAQDLLKSLWAQEVGKERSHDMATRLIYGKY